MWPLNHGLVLRHPASTGKWGYHPTLPERCFSALPPGAAVSYDGTPPATSLLMLVEIVFQYRTLIGKCALGVGLDWDEIEQMSSIEAVFAPSEDDRRMKVGRKFRREAAKLTGILRGDRINDRVDIIEVGPGGLVIRNAPFVARGEQVEIQIDVGDSSYRFRAQGVWLKDDGDDYKVGLALVGMPVCLHKIVVRKHEVDVVDTIAAAA